MKNMKKSWIRFIAFLLVFALPIISIGAVVFLAPSRFDETFLGEFEKKVDRLYEAEEAYKKLLINDMGRCRRPDKK